MGKDANLNLTRQEIAASFADPIWSAKFGPILSVDQVAELLKVPKLTVYDWKSRGLLKGCCRRVGKRLLFFRDKLLLLLFNRGLHADGQEKTEKEV